MWWLHRWFSLRQHADEELRIPDGYISQLSLSEVNEKYERLRASWLLFCNKLDRQQNSSGPEHWKSSTLAVTTLISLVVRRHVVMSWTDLCDLKCDVIISCDAGLNSLTPFGSSFRTHCVNFERSEGAPRRRPPRYTCFQFTKCLENDFAQRKKRHDLM